MSRLHQVALQNVKGMKKEYYTLADEKEPLFAV